MWNKYSVSFFIVVLHYPCFSLLVAPVHGLHNLLFKSNKYSSSIEDVL